MSRRTLPAEACISAMRSRPSASRCVWRRISPSLRRWPRQPASQASGGCAALHTQRYVVALEMLIRPAKRRTCAEREPQVEIFNGAGPLSPEKRRISQPVARQPVTDALSGHQNRTSSRFARTTSALSLRVQPRQPRSAQKKRPACRPSGGGRMRGVQAGGCLL